MEYSELSAFLVIVWYTYRNISTLKFSTIIRTIVTEATIYFLAMIAIQIYIELSLILMEVWSLTQFTLSPVIIDPNISGYHPTTFGLVSMLST